MTPNENHLEYNNIHSSNDSKQRAIANHFVNILDIRIEDSFFKKKSQDPQCQQGPPPLQISLDHFVKTENERNTFGLGCIFQHLCIASKYVLTAVLMPKMIILFLLVEAMCNQVGSSTQIQFHLPDKYSTLQWQILCPALTNNLLCLYKYFQLCCKFVAAVFVCPVICKWDMHLMQTK